MPVPELWSTKVGLGIPICLCLKPLRPSSSSSRPRLGTSMPVVEFIEACLGSRHSAQVHRGQDLMDSGSRSLLGSPVPRPDSRPSAYARIPRAQVLVYRDQGLGSWSQWSGPPRLGLEPRCMCSGLQRLGLVPRYPCSGPSKLDQVSKCQCLVPLAVHTQITNV